MERFFFSWQYSKSEKRLELIKKVWWIDGVKEVYNEIEIGPQISFLKKQKTLFLK